MTRLPRLPSRLKAKFDLTVGVLLALFFLVVALHVTGVL